MRLVIKAIMFSQVILYVCLAVCILLLPAGLATNDGISYYGIYQRTVVPYTMGLLGAAYFCGWTARILDDKRLRFLKLSLLVYPVLLVGIALTPYSVGRWFDYLHTGFGSALFSLQLILSGWLVWKLHYVWWGIILTVLEFAAGVASLIYLSPTHGFLLQTQVLFQVAFGSLLVLSLRRLLPPARKHV